MAVEAGVLLLNMHSLSSITLQESSIMTLWFNEYDKNDAKDETKLQVLYEDPDSDLCLVKSFQLYVSKLHKDCTAFLQKPADNFLKTGQWYCNAPIGKNILLM